MPQRRERLHIVLHQIRSPENLGAITRLMANFGFERLILSEPLTVDIRAAEKTAVKSTGLLERMALHPTLEAALGEAVYAVGTTSRAAVQGRTPLSPEEAVARLWQEASRGTVALVFGGEQRGLSDAELDRCNDVLVIPTEPPQPSMNLAQSAAVLLYLCARELRPIAEPLAAPEGARFATLHALEARMREVLLDAEFLNSQAPDHVLRELGQTLLRARLTQREAELWLTAFAHLRRHVLRR
jgi:tRNA/rRNA methyltransferase